MPSAPIAIRRLDVTALAALEAPGTPGASGVDLVLFHDDVALGRRFLPVESLPMTEAAVGALAAEIVGPAVAARTGRPEDAADPLAPAALARHAAAIALPDTPRATVSVLVCTRDRPDDLARCLASLRSQVADVLEVIVVDNAPDRPQTAAVVARFPFARRVAEPRRGLSRARNAGLRAARGEIVAFVDDDVEVHGRWAARVAAAFDRPDVMAVTGQVLPAELGTDAQIAFEWDYGGFGRGFRAVDFRDTLFRPRLADGPPVWEVGAGANMALRRSVLARVGGFDERLGAGAAGCSEDSEFWYRIMAAGGECRYDPASVVFHRHRRTEEELAGQLRAYMRGHVAALLVQHARHGHRGNLHRAFVFLPRYYAAHARTALAPSEGRLRRRWWAELRGVVAGYAALAWCRRRHAPSEPWPDGSPVGRAFDGAERPDPA